MSPTILFFDCYIISKTWDVDATYRRPDAPYLNVLAEYRSMQNSYRHQHKIDIVKYVLASYRQFKWDHVVIRYECEDIEETEEFYIYCKKLFPESEIYKARSANAEAWQFNLLPLRKFGNPWVFFCPNNDHPMIGDPEDLASSIELAEDIERIYPDHLVSVLYSHWTESQNIAPFESQWGVDYGNQATILGQTGVARIVKNSLFLCDSIQVFRLEFLLTIFRQTQNNGRLIRLEESGFYLARNVKFIQIYPNREICRHYDSYIHAIHYVPPLFIPDGFFTNDVKVRFGFQDYKVGFVNINPIKAYSYLGGIADLRCLVSELPRFWKERVSTVDYANELTSMSTSANLFDAHLRLKNPNRESYFGEFYLNSAQRLLRSVGLHYQLQAKKAEKILLRGKEVLDCSHLENCKYLAVFVESGIIKCSTCSYFQGSHLTVKYEDRSSISALEDCILVIIYATTFK